MMARKGRGSRWGQGREEAVRRWGQEGEGQQMGSRKGWGSS